MSKRPPTVSIGLPVYNGQDYLTEALESLLGQTYADFELILSDNGSSDATPAICRQFAVRDSRIRYDRQEKNQGAAWNFNHVFELARGRFFRWAAHDDLCAPTLLQRCVPVLENDPAVVLCFTGVGLIGADGQPLAEANMPRVLRRNARLLAEIHRRQRRRDFRSRHSWRRYFDVLLNTHWVFEIFGLIRAEALRQTRLHRPYYGSDKTLLAELSLLGPFHEIPEVLFFSRRHAAQSGSMDLPRQRDQWLAPCNGRWPRPWPRLRTAWGHASVIPRAPISWRQRLLCLLVVARYLAQGSKWRRMIREGFGRICCLSREYFSGRRPRRQVSSS